MSILANMSRANPRTSAGSMASVNRPFTSGSFGSIRGWKSPVEATREMEQELAQFKRIVADLTLQNRVLKDVIKKALRACQKRELVDYAGPRYRI